MRNFLLPILALLLFPGVSSSAVLDCTVPSAIVPRAVELCEILRIQSGFSTADWSNDLCATIFLQRGLRQFEVIVTKEGSRASAEQELRDAIDAFESAWPAIRPTPTPTPTPTP